MDLDLLEKRNIKKIAVYGMDQKGKKLYDELVQAGQEVIGIEKINHALDHDYHIFYMHEEEVPKTDAVVIVPEKEYEFIRWELYNFISDSCIVLRISDIYSEKCRS